MIYLTKHVRPGTLSTALHAPSACVGVAQPLSFFSESLALNHGHDHLGKMEPYYSGPCALQTGVDIDGVVVIFPSNPCVECIPVRGTRA
ncbi:hypothetical protein CY34DRAFT_342580 [Suillus luteus UH-Slu-Lm8-n1]|uniref:Uncharacterized protein n=1 Tax=Suillus luteus UH-Slu-Lm8-n1 TaxID=930992 RepID=A0A0D0ABX7_9AGAM|nr:hypothetical protein CY34DRAFT_342580 [Suillus luteus UH-Slu-Lm8-n1]